MAKDRVKKFYLGLDIGGTSIRMACIDLNYELIGVIKKSDWKPEKTAPAVIKVLILEIYGLIEKYGLDSSELKGIGISLAAIFERRSGNIIKWPNHQSWNGYPFKKMLQKEFQVPIIIEDDCNCAALAEGRFGNGFGYKDFLYVNIGTGIGSSIMLNKNCYTGSNGFAGEIGHIRLTQNGPRCKCGKKGCLQAYASGPAFMKRTEKLASEMGEKIVITNIRQIHEFKLKGKLWALKAVNEFTACICMGISQLIMTLDLPLIILGGGVIEAYPELLDCIRIKIDEWILPLDRKIEIRSAKFKDHSGVIGATSLIFDEKGKRNLYEENSNY